MSHVNDHWRERLELLEKRFNETRPDAKNDTRDTIKSWETWRIKINRIKTLLNLPTESTATTYMYFKNTMDELEGYIAKRNESHAWTLSASSPSRFFPAREMPKDKTLNSGNRFKQ